MVYFVFVSVPILSLCNTGVFQGSVFFYNRRNRQRVRTMHEIISDVFYDLARRYDPNSEFHMVGEVDYHLLRDEKAHEGLKSHKEALIAVFKNIKEKENKEREEARETRGDAYADQLIPLTYDIGKAQATPLDPQTFFYCPNIVKSDRYGNVWYDAVWEPNDENCGTTVPYWYALMEPIQRRSQSPEDFRKVNETLFPNGTDELVIYEWTTDWSDLFDAGHEWYGACCWSIYDRSMDRYVVMLVSATD